MLTLKQYSHWLKEISIYEPVKSKASLVKKVPK